MEEEASSRKSLTYRVRGRYKEESSLSRQVVGTAIDSVGRFKSRFKPRVNRFGRLVQVKCQAAIEDPVAVKSQVDR